MVIALNAITRTGQRIKVLRVHWNLMSVIAWHRMAMRSATTVNIMLPPSARVPARTRKSVVWITIPASSAFN